MPDPTAAAPTGWCRLEIDEVARRPRMDSAFAPAAAAETARGRTATCRTSRLRLALVPIAILAIAAGLGAGPTARAQAPAPYAFTVLGPEGAVARVITPDPVCPQLMVDGAAQTMQVRAAPDADFAVTVCDAPIPAGAGSASINGQALALPAASPQRVVVLGDTGCRLKGKKQQPCNDPAAWPFAAVADQAAAGDPDLVIHVGDYHYRETACDEGNAGCAGSPFGDNWPAWEADFFAPTGELLTAAPWVFVVGNHEDCERAGMGFFRFLDPRPMPAACPDYTDPYAVAGVDPQLIVMDDSGVDDLKVEPDQLAAYTAQFEQIRALAQGTSWLLLHDPLYVFGHLGEKDGAEQRFIDQLTLQQASGNAFPPGMELFVGGHVHLFQALSFGAGRPPQLVAGNGGTLLDPPVTTPLTGLEMAGQPVAYGTMLDQFGFVAMERAPDGWTMAVKGTDGAVLESCVLGDGELLCGETGRAKQAAARSRQLAGGLGLLLAFLAVLVLVVLLRRSSANAPRSGGAAGG